jgi:hypothetical protein
MQRVSSAVAPSWEAKLQSPRVLAAISAAIFLLVLGDSFHPFSINETFPLSPEALTLARRLAESGSFASPFLAMATGPTAHLAPVYPAFLAFLIHIFGSGPWGAFVLQNTAAAAVAMEVALLPLVAEALGMGIEAGIFAALAAMIARLPSFFAWEANYVAVLLECLTLVIFMPNPSALRRFWYWIFLGALWGFALLSSPVIALPFAGWLLSRGGGRPAFGNRRELWTVFAVAIVVVAPWIVRNYSTFGKFIFIRDSLGIELAVANNPCASYAIRISESTGCYGPLHPNISATQAAKVVRMGEPAYNSALLEDALHWIVANPEKFLQLTLRRFFYFWFPSDRGDAAGEILHGPARAHYAAIFGSTILSLYGLWALWRRNRPAAAWCALWLALFPLIYYFVLFIERYRYPVLWITFLLAGYAVADILSIVRGSRLPVRSRSV